MGNEYVLEMKNVCKSFPGVQALQNVSLAVKPGEVHALMGENGAGKSTLMKILMGIYSMDSGEIHFNGKKVDIGSPGDALKMGISMIHQELSPVPYMTISENIFLGREDTYKNTPFVNKKCLNEKTARLLKEFNMDFLKPTMKMQQLCIAHKQMIEIIKAVSYDSRVIVMDEPTSALSADEVKELFKTIKSLKHRDVGIIYISHRMEEIFELADRVTVLRDGQFIGAEEISDINTDKLIRMMVGRELTNIFPKLEVDIRDIVLEIKNLTLKGVFRNISLHVRKGEILGIAGLVGSGRSEIMRAIFGIDPPDGGEIYVEGTKVNIKKPSDAKDAGIAMVTEDRKELGLVLCRSIKENVILPELIGYCNGPFINKAQENNAVLDITKLLGVKMSGINQTVGNLSGGNQQKVVLAKWLLGDLKVLILDEPTRGIDVGAKSEIHKIMGELAKQGLAIIMISSEMPEVMGMSDRIIVIGDGQVKGEFKRNEATQEDILKCALYQEAVG